MAQKFSNSDGTLVIPTATAAFQVARQNSGLGTSGVVAIVGEADMGLAYDEEADIEDGATFGPDQVTAVVAKYGSGPLVDAFKAAAQPANDPNITGAPNRIILAKVNVGTPASLPLLTMTSGAYGTLYTKAAGRNGNQLFSSAPTATQVLANTEVVPTTGSFTFIPPVGVVTSEVRLNGGAALVPTLGANITPTNAATAFNGLAGVGCTGGVNRAMVAGAVGTVKIDVVLGNSVTFTRSVDWSVMPVVGDTIVVPVGSAMATDSDGAGPDTATPQNVGAYVVTELVSTKIIKATKLSDAEMGGAVAGVISAPITKIAVNLAGANTDIVAYSPLVISVDAGTVVDGIGKSLEISEQAGADLLSRCCYALSPTAVTWVSKTGAAKLLTSSNEYKVTIDLTRQNDSVSEEITTGGSVAMRMSYLGTTCTVTITSTHLTTTKAGGAGGNLNIVLADFSTIADLVAYINAQTGYSAAVGNTTLGQYATSTLDRVTAQGICSTWNGLNGRIKMDAYQFFTAVSDSATVQLGATPARAAAGLPLTATSTSFFSGGARGSSTNSRWTGALDALSIIEANFIVTAVARDATSDIADNLTDSGSTYTVDSINAYLRTHVLACSKLKKRKNRQGFTAKMGTFAEAKEAASNLASPRMVMCFQDNKAIDSQGNLAQMQPWYGAAQAAGAQAAGFYRAIVRKFANISGAVQAAGDCDDRDDTKIEEALLAGLLPLRRHPNGGWYWVSDQTTYSKDDNFVYNSIQAMYAADTIAMTTARRMEDAFLGQSVADISASGALTFLEGIMADFRRLKLIAASDDAPLGFKNAKVTISGPAMIVEVEVKLAGAIYFIPINFYVSPVTQTANQG
jgi:hypothetical protein